MKIELKPLHRELMIARNERLAEAQEFLRRREVEFRGALILIAQDLGADLKQDWHLSKDFSKIECEDPTGAGPEEKA